MRIKYSHRSWKRKYSFRGKVLKMMKCICTSENLRVDDEEARALLGRLEFRKRNIEALGVFEGIDVTTMTAKIEMSLLKRDGYLDVTHLGKKPPPMSMHDVSLLFEAIIIKAKSLPLLGRVSIFSWLSNATEAALSCKVITDTVESAVAEGLAENFASHSILGTLVELLPRIIGNLFMNRNKQFYPTRKASFINGVLTLKQGKTKKRIYHFHSV